MWSRRSPLFALLARVLIAALVLASLPVPATASVRVDSLRGHIHADGLGSVRRLTDEQANITDGYTHSAFGQLLSHTGTDPQPYAFTGEPLDLNSGWQYHRARWMDPSVGRFTGMDPWEGRPADPVTLHRYLYVGNDAVNGRDPTGLYEGGLTGSFITMAAVVTLSAAALLSYNAAVSTTRSDLSEPSTYYRVVGLAMTVAQVKLEQAAQQASMSLNVTGAVVQALPIMIQEFNGWRRTDDFKRPGNHGAEFWYPTGPANRDSQVVRSYTLGSVRFTEMAGGGGGRVFMFVYKIGRNPVPGRGLFRFRLDYLSYETYPPVFQLEYHLVVGNKVLKHVKL